MSARDEDREHEAREAAWIERKEIEDAKCPDCGGEDIGWQHREWDTDNGHGEVEFQQCRECHFQWDHT
jgi:DNA-directed RNA polymerase subunit M/transcription elongation factor TFIIS